MTPEQAAELSNGDVVMVQRVHSFDRLPERLHHARMVVRRVHMRQGIEFLDPDGRPSFAPVKPYQAEYITVCETGYIPGGTLVLTNIQPENVAQLVRKFAG